MVSFLLSHSSASFVHLKLHSEYSICDGLVRIDDLVQHCKQLAMPAVAITDLNNLFAMVKFFRQAIKAKVKPIVGAEVLLREGGNFFPITFLCQNNRGYKNLTQLISKAYIEGQGPDGLPKVEWQWIATHAEGLIALSGGRFGDVGNALLLGHHDLVQQRVARWQQAFPDRFYLELTRTDRPQEEDYIHAAVALALQYDVPVVATNDVRFMQQDDFDAHEARVCIHAGYVLEDEKRPRNYSEQQYFKSAEQMQELFSDIPEALENANAIMQRCNLKLKFGEVFLPQFPVPEGMTVDVYFAEQAQVGLQQRLKKLKITEPAHVKIYQDRLQRELDVIIKMGFPGYYLIVADFIQWAKDHAIPVGPGRGSGAGSLIAYVLGITELDPIKHELLFERFLNPERVSMPDFDIDFCMEQRDRVIDYVAERYGRESVSQIITYGTMAAKAVVRDVGRVLGLPYGFCDKIAKLIPFELGITLDKALAQEEQLRERYSQEPEVETLIDLAKKLEGITRNAGKHAGGVVIAPSKLTDFSPLYCESGGGNLVTQFDKDDVEAVGLVKFDFLGLRTLTIIDWAVQAINQRLQQEGRALIDITDIPLDDVKTFVLLKDCMTTAVFQLESRGMKELIRRLQPDCFEEITALVALFRPGPLQSGMVDDFIDRKHGRSEVRYPHADLEPILRPTYGVILYQEQVMQIAQVLANYSLGGADILRRAMGKKKLEEMAEQRIVFREGAKGRGIDPKVAEHIFDLMEKFAGYGFNKSHSAAYALIAYQTAWLKAHYPAEFMAAVLSSDMDNTDKVVGFLEECEHMSLKVSSPNVNLAQYAFTVNAQGEIVYGLGAIKGVGEAAALHIIEEREKNGPYKDLFSFCQRLDTHKVNRRVLEPLILSGAFDDFGRHRASLSASVNKALKASDQYQRNQEMGQQDLFGSIADMTAMDQEQTYEEVPLWSESVRLQGEKDTLGWYVSGHPIGAYEVEFRQFTTTTISQLKQYCRKEVTIAGMLISLRVINTRTGKRMAVIVLEDRSGRVEVTIFTKLYEQVSRQLETEKVYVIGGKVEDDDYTGGVRIVADTLRHIGAVRSDLVKRLLIKVHDREVDDILQNLPIVITPYKGGRCPIAISYKNNNAYTEMVLGDAWKVTPSDEFLDQLRKVCEVELEY